MKPWRPFWRHLWASHGAATLRLAFLLALCGLSPGPATAASEPVDSPIAVIVHPATPIETLSRPHLRAIFGMNNRAWEDGAAIRVFVLADADPIHAQFAKKVLNTFPYNLRRIWDRRVYSGIGQSPTTVNSQEEMRAIVAATEHAVGYLSRDLINGTIKVVELKP